MQEQHVTGVGSMASSQYTICCYRWVFCSEGMGQMIHAIARGRAKFGKILVTVLVFVLLCGIVVGEFPELLSLTDNASNDFTMTRTKSAALPVLMHAGHLPAADINCNILAATLLFSHLKPFAEAASIPSERSILRSVLRT
jgi:hypothetical protein